MIKNISLKNFKCFENINVECRELNLFTGINGMGKSTLIQALLLLRQTYEKYNSSDDIYSVVSIVNAHIKSIDHAKLTHGKMSYRHIEFDGRTPNYGNYEFVEDYKYDRIVGSCV